MMNILRNLGKVIAFLILLLFKLQAIFAQGMDENPEVRNSLNPMFSILENSKVPNGLISDYIFVQDMKVDLPAGNDMDLTDDNLWEQKRNSIGFPLGDPNQPILPTALVDGSYAPEIFPSSFLTAVPQSSMVDEKNRSNGLSFDASPSAEFITDSKLNADAFFLPSVNALAAADGSDLSASALSSSANAAFAADVLLRDAKSGHQIELLANETAGLNAPLIMGIDGPKLGKTGSQYRIINAIDGAVIWSSSNPSIASISSSGMLTAVGKGIVDIKARVGTSEIAMRVAVGTPRFVLGNEKREPGFYTIKANCIDTEPGYADFIVDNKDLLVYQWGIKTENQKIQWTDSESSEVKLSITEDTENSTIYLKVKDYNGHISSPIFVRITGYDIYDIGFRTFILNKNGQLFTSTGYKLYYEGTGMPLVFRNASFDQFSNAEWIPLAGKIINDQQTQWVVPWYTNFYIKDMITLKEIERIKSTFSNDQVAIYTFYLLNYEGKIIQKTPLSVIYKENYPN